MWSYESTEKSGLNTSKMSAIVHLIFIINSHIKHQTKTEAE